jgi:hypothetical protein
MGLFSFIGKAIKGVAKALPVVGTVLDVAEGVGSVIGHKSRTPGSVTGAKGAALAKLQQQISRGKAPTAPVYARPGGVATAVPRQVYSQTPVMPGGAVATASGVVPAASASPPQVFSGSRGSRSSSRRRPRRAVTRVRSPAPRKKRRAARKLKFGSPAWRKKYMKKKRR